MQSVWATRAVIWTVAGGLLTACPRPAPELATAPAAGTSAASPAPSPASPAPSPAKAEPAPRRPPAVIAVFDLDDGTRSLSPADVAQLADYLAVRIASLPDTRVVPRDQLRQAIAQAKADSYRACFDQSCQIELGKALSAEKSLATKLLRVGGRCAMTAVLFDLRTETTERAASIKTECAADALLGAADELVRQLGGGAAPEASPSIASAPRAHPAAKAASQAEAAPMELVLDESGRAAEVTARDDATAGRADPAPPRSEPPKPWIPRFNGRRGQSFLVLPGAVSFGPGRDDLSESSRRVLDQVAAGILADPRLRTQSLMVVGHADGSERGRAELSERRARAARTYLMKKGLSVARLGVVGVGDGDPLTAVDRFDARQRRVELRAVNSDGE